MHEPLTNDQKVKIMGIALDVMTIDLNSAPKTKDITAAYHLLVSAITGEDKKPFVGGG